MWKDGVTPELEAWLVTLGDISRPAVAPANGFKRNFVEGAHLVALREIEDRVAAVKRQNDRVIGFRRLNLIEESPDVFAGRTGTPSTGVGFTDALEPRAKYSPTLGSVGPVMAVVAEPQIDDPVISRVAVNVIDYGSRPSAVVERPSQPVGEHPSALERDFQIPFGMRATSQLPFPRVVAKAPIDRPDDLPRGGVVGKNRAQQRHVKLRLVWSR